MASWWYMLDTPPAGVQKFMWVYIPLGLISFRLYKHPPQQVLHVAYSMYTSQPHDLCVIKVQTRCALSNEAELSLIKPT